MLRIDRILKPWNESGSLNAQINLYGFWNDEVFLTKSGDLGIVLRVRGVDYESLDQAAQEYAVKRLEAALKIFGPGFHVYQYLLKDEPAQHSVRVVRRPCCPSGDRSAKGILRPQTRPIVRSRNLLRDRH